MQFQKAQICRQNIYKYKPKPLTLFSSTLNIDINNKQDLRAIITNFILHNIDIDKKYAYNPSIDNGQQNEQKYKRNGAEQNKKKSRNKHPINVNYPKIPLQVTVNNQVRRLEIDLQVLLRIYIKISSKKQYQGPAFSQNIQPMIVDVLNFIDSVEQKIKGINFQIPQKLQKSQANKVQNLEIASMKHNQKNLISDVKIVEKIVTMIIERHLKQKNKIHFTYQDQQKVQCKITAKNVRVSFIDISDHLKRKQKQFTLEVKNPISKFSASFFPQETNKDDFIVIPNKISVVSDKLNQLFEGDDFFSNTQKLQKLREEALMRFYDINQNEYHNKKQKILLDIENQYLPEQNNDCKYENKMFEMQADYSNPNRSNVSLFNNSQQNLSMIKKWLAQIQLSQKLYDSKFGKANRCLKSHKAF